MAVTQTVVCAEPAVLVSRNGTRVMIMLTLEKLAVTQTDRCAGLAVLVPEIEYCCVDFDFLTLTFWL